MDYFIDISKVERKLKIPKYWTVDGDVFEFKENGYWFDSSDRPIFKWIEHLHHKTWLSDEAFRELFDIIVNRIFWDLSSKSVEINNELEENYSDD